MYRERCMCVLYVDAYHLSSSLKLMLPSCVSSSSPMVAVSSPSDSSMPIDDNNEPSSDDWDTHHTHEFKEMNPPQSK